MTYFCLGIGRILSLSLKFSNFTRIYLGLGVILYYIFLLHGKPFQSVIQEYFLIYLLICFYFYFSSRNISFMIIFISFHFVFLNISFFSAMLYNFLKIIFHKFVFISIRSTTFVYSVVSFCQWLHYFIQF